MKAWEKNINKSTTSYLNSSYKKFQSYQRFRFVKETMDKRLRQGGDFLDMGCAKGEFIWYLKDFFPDINFTGVDISSQLISLAKSEPKLSDARFIKADLQGLDLGKKFDFVFMSGVLSIFDDCKKLLRQMTKHLKPGGWGYIFGRFTEDDIDVLVRYRNNYLGSKHWESGLNMFSLNTIRKALLVFSDKINFYKFALSMELPKIKNPVGSYTLNTAEQGRIILNGANILAQFYLVEFRRHKKR